VVQGVRFLFHTDEPRLMSEMQTEYESEADFGKWISDIDFRTGEHFVDFVTLDGERELIAAKVPTYDDARLIAAAGNAAREVEEMGYDAVESMKALPELLYVAERLRRESEAGDASLILCSIAGNAKDALASAEGVKDE